MTRARAREKAIKIMEDHGLYCVPLASAGIGLTDKDGNVYDVVIVSPDADGLVVDENTTIFFNFEIW